MKIVKFGSVGVLNTAFSYLLFCGLIHLDVFYLFASTLSFLAGTLFSYLMNSRFTFSVYTNTRSFLKFFAIMLVSLTGSLLLLYVFRNAVGLHTLVAQLLVVLVRFPIVYLLLKRVVFDRVQSY
ncbi:MULTISPECIES: GtrA family protein [Vibrio harveyi group]|uniref:GtrA family protein n=1 Tax=Vibrio harveyi group TaxID=717610 RepID=UPI000576ECF6|nr:GtrA family protein [Vibrio campbellii]